MPTQLYVGVYADSPDCYTIQIVDDADNLSPDLLTRVQGRNTPITRYIVPEATSLVMLRVGLDYIYSWKLPRLVTNTIEINTAEVQRDYVFNPKIGRWE